MQEFLRRIKSTAWSLLVLYVLTIIVCIIWYWPENIWACVICLTIFCVLFLLLYWIGLMAAKAASIGCIMSLLYFLIIPLIACKYFFRDLSSYEIDNLVVENERMVAFKRVYTRYNASVLMHDSALSGKLLLSNSPILELDIDESLGQHLMVDSFSMFMKKEAAKMDHPAYYYYFEITIHDKKDSLSYFYMPPPPGIQSKGGYIRSVRSVVNSKNRDVLSNLNDLRARENSIRKGTFWTYESVLPYFITSQNIKPKTRSANYLYFFHEKLFWGILLTFVIGIILSKVFEQS